MKKLLITLTIFVISVCSAHSQYEIDSANNIKSRFGVGYGIVAVDMDSKVPIRNSYSFHLRFTLKPITKYLFIEFAANIYPEYIKHENTNKDVTSKNFSFSPLFGKSDNSGRMFLYFGPSVDFNINELPKVKSGFGVTLRVDYSFTKIVAAGINLKYMSLSGSQSSSYFLGNLNMSFTL
ncbi:MAG: hypothetical protein WCK13_05615 [Ignavibacteriota bacterium]